MKNKSHLLILAAIFIIAFALRFYHLSNVPNGLHADEASLGYNAYSIVKTGKDEANHFMPLYIDMFGDNRPTGYHFLDTIPVFFLGLTIFATRLPGALFGSLLVFSVYFLAETVFKDRKTALLSAFLVAVAPWSIVLSRASDEAVVALVLILTGFAFLLKSLDSKKTLQVAVGTILVIISFFFYHTPRVFVPTFFLIIISYIFLNWKKYTPNYKTFIIGCFLITSVISFTLVFLISGGTGRFGQVNIFGYPATKLVMEEQVREDGILGAGGIQGRLVHNKLTSYFITASSNYLEYFSIDFLFVSGGLPRWYIVPQMGELYLIELPFVLAGLYFITRNSKPQIILLVICALLVPVTAAFTVDDVPNVNRVIELFPLIDIIIAFGLVSIFHSIPKRFRKLFMIIIIIAFIYNFTYFLHQYFVNSQIHKNWYRNEGVEQMMEVVKENYSKYDKIFITKDTGGIYPLVLFYMKYNPKLYQEEGSTKDQEYTGFGKFYFVPQMCPSVNGDDRFPKGKILYIEQGTCKPLKLKKQDYIRRYDGSPVFHIVY